MSIDEKDCVLNSANNNPNNGSNNHLIDSFSTPMKLQVSIVLIFFTLKEAKKKADDEQRLLNTAALKSVSIKNYRLLKIICGKNRCRYIKWKAEIGDKEELYMSLMNKLGDSSKEWYFQDSQGDWAPIFSPDELEIALEILDEKILTLSKLN